MRRVIAQTNFGVRHVRSTPVQMLAAIMVSVTLIQGFASAAKGSLEKTVQSRSALTTALAMANVTPRQQNAFVVKSTVALIVHTRPVQETAMGMASASMELVGAAGSMEGMTAVSFTAQTNVLTRALAALGLELIAT